MFPPPPPATSGNTSSWAHLLSSVSYGKASPMSIKSSTTTLSAPPLSWKAVSMYSGSMFFDSWSFGIQQTRCMASYSFFCRPMCRMLGLPKSLQVMQSCKSTLPPLWQSIGTVYGSPWTLHLQKALSVMVASFISSYLFIISYRVCLSYLIIVLVLSLLLIYGCGLVSS